MLIEIWERLRGYDKWIQKEATVESSEPTNYQLHGRDLSYSEDVIVWTDSAGEKHRAAISVQAHSPLFQLVQGSMVGIRYNPADPEEYYLREVIQTRVRKVLSTALVTALMIAALAFFGWLRTLSPPK